MTLIFDGVKYQHRWSKDGQNEFTPQGQSDLTAWREMVTLNVHKDVSSGDGLAGVANNILGLYQEHGHIMHTDSKRRTLQSPAEHFMAAFFAQSDFFEAAFVRVMLHDKAAMVIVYSRRFYGEKAQKEMTDWLDSNGKRIEKALMSWGSIQALRNLEKLPQS